MKARRFIKRAASALWHFVTLTYKDPVWIISAGIFVGCVAWLVQSVNSLLSATDSSLQTVADMQSHDRDMLLGLNMFHALNKAMIFQLQIEQILLTPFPHVPKSDEERLQCQHVVEAPRLPFTAVSGIVEGTRIRDPELADLFQRYAKVTLESMNKTELWLQQFCEAQDPSKLELLIHERQKDHIEFLAYSYAFEISLINYFSAFQANGRALISADARAKRAFRFNLAMDCLAAMYAAVFVASALRSWWHYFPA